MNIRLSLGAAAFALGLAFACSDDESSGGKGSEAGAAGEAAGGSPEAGSSATQAGSGGADETGLGGAGALVERGEYLVKHVSVCVDCHTPTVNGVPDMTKFLAGTDCLFDAIPGIDTAGCVSTANLTNDATGLKNRTDQEIKDMFLTGVRPDGSAMLGIMPYWSYGNMSDDDANAIVAYLRTVPAVKRTAAPSQPPFDAVEEPSTRVDLEQVPMPDAKSADFDSAMRGRYLAAQAGVCLECHTPSNPIGSAEPRDLSKAFWGGEAFDLGPIHSVSHNLTPHETGLGGWTKQDIVNALKKGVTPEQVPLCPPMPAGPMGAFGGLTDDDAMDIATYLQTLEPADNAVAMCVIDMPGMGGAGGADGGAVGGAGGAGGAN